ncbi:MAG TPA: zinc ribbon domain-containing protein [Polyangiaceae bacterium]|jgi:hypothetical protein
MADQDSRVASDDAERALARTASWVLPAATVLTAILIGTLFGVGPAFLVLAAGALVGVILLLWASLRTLGGEAPLAEGLVAAASMKVEVSDVSERKRRVLRALKDLELEHSIGKLDDDDYAQISARYRKEAKDILKEMDVEIEPLRAKAEAVARAHLAKRGLAEGTGEGATAKSEEAPKERAPTKAENTRPACAKCNTSNDADAAFCKKCGGLLTAREAEPAKEASDATG